MTIYITKRIRAEEDNLETNFPKVGTGISAFIICTEPEFELGKIANAKTKTPMPPIKCVKLRQNNIECDKASTSFNILEPVVVKPLEVSKKASIKEGISPLKTNGNAPKAETKIQERETMTNPSFAYNLCKSNSVREKVNPIPNIKIAVRIKLIIYLIGSR